MKSHIFSFVKFFIGWPLSIAALFFIFRLLGKQGSASFLQLPHANPLFLTLGVLFFLFYFLLRSFFWQKLLKYAGFSISFDKTTYLWEISELKRFIPGNIWSFLGRAEAFSSLVPQKTTAKLLTVEILYIFLGSLAASILSIPFIVSLKSLSFGLFIPGAIILLLLLAFITGQKFILNKFHLGRKIQSIFAYSSRQHFFLFFLSTVSFLFFGLGMYFSTISVYALPIVFFPAFIGLFNLAFFIGYSSLITPMGLGVREAIVVWGLSPFLQVAQASFIAIFTRIISIFAELLFLLLTSIIFYRKHAGIHKIKNWIVTHRHEIILGILVCTYIFYYSLASFLRYKNFYTGRFDLGNMDQTVWNTLHGRIFQFTNPDGTNIISRLSFHADFILVLLAPFYLLWQDPRMLLLIQSIVLGLGAVFIYLLGKDVIKNKGISLILAFSYLINPSVGFSNLYDFHAVTLATTFLLGACYFLLKKKYIVYLCFLLLAALTKEQIWLVLVFFGVWTLIKSNRKLGIVLTVTSALLFAFIFFYAIPHAHGGSHFALSYYSDYGSSSGQIAKTLVLSPLHTLEILFSPKRLLYLNKLFLPIGYMAFISPVFLLFALPDFLFNLLSSNPNLQQIYYQYTSVITPFLFLSTIYATKKILSKFPNSFTFLSFYFLFCALLGAFLFGPLPGSKSPNTDMFAKPLLYADTIDNFIDFIPMRYSIAATNNVGSHLSHRQRIYTIPTGLEQADVIIFLLNDKFAQPSPDAQVQMAIKLAQDSNYVELFREQNFVAFAKKSLNFQKRLKKERKYFPFIRQLFPHG